MTGPDMSPPWSFLTHVLIRTTGAGRVGEDASAGARGIALDIAEGQGHHEPEALRRRPGGSRPAQPGIGPAPPSPPGTAPRTRGTPGVAQPAGVLVVRLADEPTAPELILYAAKSGTSPNI